MLLGKRIEVLTPLLGKMMKSRQWMIVAAESCSGGQLASAITNISGSSEWFDSSVVSYSNRAKIHFLGVSRALLQSEGAVSEACAKQMLNGIAIKPNFLAVATTGFAGPSGDSVGLVYIAWQLPGRKPDCQNFLFKGSREQIIQQVVYNTLRAIILASLYEHDLKNLSYFLAIDVEDDFKQHCEQYALDAGLSIEQIEPQSNLHLTLAYLGPLTAKKLHEFKKSADVFTRYHSFEIRFTELAYWSTSDAFLYLAEDPKMILQEFATILPGVSQDQFIPHVTICKKAGIHSKTVKLGPFEGAFRAKKITLMASFYGIFYIQQYQWCLQ